MVTVSDFAQFLLSKEPEKLPARQSLYNFLKYLCPLHAEFEPRVLERFFSLSLQYSYWRKRSPYLFEPLINELKEFYAQQQYQAPLITELVQSQQVVEIEHRFQLETLITKHIRSQIEVKKLKLHSLPSNKILAISLKMNDELRVEVYSRLALIKNGELSPLLPLTRLHYNSLMELKKNKTQLIELKPMTLVRFQAKDSGEQGLYLKNYNLEFDKHFNGSIELQPKLHQGLKSIEQYFIDLSTDSEYSSISSKLKEAIEYQRIGHSESLIKAQHALKLAQYALKNIFPNDKGLKYLVSELETSLLSEEICLKPHLEN